MIIFDFKTKFTHKRLLHNISLFYRTIIQILVLTTQNWFDPFWWREAVPSTSGSQPSCLYSYTLSPDRCVCSWC